MADVDRDCQTLFVTICLGRTAPGCGREIAHRFVPWKGQPVVESHGICAHCAAREEIAALRASTRDEAAA